MGDLLYYNYAADGLLAVTTLPAIFFATAGFCLVRRQRDAARYGFGFFKAAMVFYAIFLICLLSSYIFLSLVGDAYIGDAILFTRSILVGVAHLMDNITDCLIFLTLARISIDIIFVYNDNNPSLPKNSLAFKLISRGLKGVKLAVNTIGAIFIVLSSADFCVCFARLQFYNPGGPDRIYGFAGYTHGGSVIGFPLTVMLCIAAMLLCMRCIVVFVQCYRDSHVHNAVKYLAVCAVLWFMRTISNLVFVTMFTDQSTGERNGNIIVYGIVIDQIFSIWPTMVIFSLLLALSRKKKSGLWSVNQLDHPLEQLKLSGTSTDHHQSLRGSTEDATTQDAPASAGERPSLQRLSTRLISTTARPEGDIRTSESALERTVSGTQPTTTPGTQSPSVVIPAGLTAQQTPWGYGYFVPQDPNQPVQPIWPTRPEQYQPPNPSRRRELPVTDAPPDYAQHMHDARHQPEASSSRLPQGDQAYGDGPQLGQSAEDVDNIEEIGLDHQADGVPPQTGDPSEFADKKKGDEANQE